MLTIREAIIVEGRYDKIKLSGLVNAPIIETGGFRVFSDREKQSLIRQIAEKRGILVLTDSDGAGFVIRNFLRGVVPKEQMKHCYIPQIAGKERRWSNAEIATELVVSVRTVETHVSSLLRKLGVHDRRALAPSSRDLGEPPEPAESRIRFVEVSGGRSLAVAESGFGPTLVKAATGLTQVDKDTADSLIWGHWVRAFAARYRYVRYDARGCGLSDRDLGGADLSDLDLWIDDLEAVLDSLGEEPVALLGDSQGGPVAFGFAARHPERVSRLVLYGTYARGMRRRDDPLQVEEAAVNVGIARLGWSQESELLRETFARQYVPDAGPDEIRAFNEQLRTSTTPINAPLVEAAFYGLDASDLARTVTVPTLVLHAIGDRGVPFEEGRRLAGLIPGARFVSLNGRNHILMQRDVAFAQFLDEVERFLAN